METRADEIADGIFRLSTLVPEAAPWMVRLAVDGSVKVACPSVHRPVRTIVSPAPAPERVVPKFEQVAGRVAAVCRSWCQPLCGTPARSIRRWRAW